MHVKDLSFLVLPDAQYHLTPSRTSLSVLWHCKRKGEQENER